MDKNLPIYLFFCLILTFQVQAADDYFSMSFDELMQVKVTGSTLVPQELHRVPSAVTYFTRKEIQNMGLDSLHELINLVPGYQSYRTSFLPQNYSISSRGRRIGSTIADILILVDGQRMDSPRSSGSGSGIEIPLYPLSNIERVEFIRGPGAPLYGSNAMMGVINIITRQDVNELTASYGYFNQQSAGIKHAHSFNGFKWNLLANFNKDDGDSFAAKDTFSDDQVATDDPRKIADINIKLNWKKTQINYQHYRLDAENYFLMDNLSNNTNRQNSRFSSFSIKQAFNWKKLSSSIWLGYHQASVRVKSQLSRAGALFAASGGASNDPLLFQINFKNSTETRLQWHNLIDIDYKSHFQLGVELRYIKTPKTLSKNNFDLADIQSGTLPVTYFGDLLETTVVHTASSRKIVGVYSQYQREIFFATELTLGLRYDEFINLGSQLSPRIGLTHELNELHSVKFLYGKAFRAPAENELNLVNNPTILGNRNLASEQVETWEAIWFAQGLDYTYSFGYYESHFNDSIVLIPTGVGSTLQYYNRSQHASRGFELDLTYQLTSRWLVRASSTHLISKPEFSFRETDNLASLLSNYRYKKWNFNVIASFQDKRLIPREGSNPQKIKLPAYLLLFGKINYQLNPHIGLKFQIKNILNKYYLTPGENINLAEGVPNRGREILIGTIWSFE